MIHDGTASGTDTFNLVILAIFLAAVWGAGRAAAFCGLAPLAGYIAAGALLGPPLAVSVPFSDALSLLGNFGLYLLVIEAGFEIELRTLKQIGGRAVFASLVGMLVGAGPLAFLIARFALGMPIREALAVAACMTPSSSGIALSTLKRRRASNTPLGQLVVDSPPAVYFVPIGVSLGSAVAVGAAAVSVVPHGLRFLLTRIVPQRHAEVTLLCLLLSLAVGLVAACSTGGASPLLGAFLAGLSFCSMSSTASIWAHQVKRIQGWLIRLFFACTVGFSIPLKLYGRRRVWRDAAALYAASWGKLAAGLFAEPLLLPEALSFGFALATLGEFSFIAGSTAHTELGLMGEQAYASVALAVLATIIISPVLLSASLAWTARRAEAALMELTRPGGGKAAAAEHVYYKVDIKCTTHVRLARRHPGTPGALTPGALPACSGGWWAA